MRRLTQPGPVHPQRIDSLRGTPRALSFALRPGVTLHEALTGPLVAAGVQSATLSFKGGVMNPFRYVMPGPPDGPAHVAYFTAPRAPVGDTRIERANATFGWADGAPFLHCHAAWIEPDGQRRGGHILPKETTVAGGADVQAWGFDTIRIEAAPDAETNFTLFQPSGASDASATGLVARVRPNEDILTALETIAAANGLRNAVVRGSLGSLIGACFTDGRRVEDHATEVLVSDGCVRGGVAELALLVVDMRGEVHAGRLVRGENPVCITFDLVLEGV